MPFEKPSGRRRPPPRRLTVRSVERVTPRLVSVVMGGEALAGFRDPQPTAHVKLFLPDASGHLPVPRVAEDGTVDWPDGRPVMRTYTPRRYDAAAGTLEVQVALHGDGVAATWAQQVVPGDQVALGGPSLGLTIDPEMTRWWIGGDASALPAVACLLEALPHAASAQVHLEVEDQDEQFAISEHPGVDVVWHTARGGGVLLEALQSEPLWPETRVWVAGEATAVRRIRSYLLTDVGHARDLVTTRGYWRVGETNHSDHDFGED